MPPILNDKSNAISFIFFGSPRGVSNVSKFTLKDAARATTRPRVLQYKVLAAPAAAAFSFK